MLGGRRLVDVRTKHIIIAITICLSPSCIYEPGQGVSEAPESIEQHAGTAAVPGVKTVKVPVVAPFSGGQGISPHVIIDYTPLDENFPGWTSPLHVENGSRIVGGRAWVRVLVGSMRLVLGVNSQVVGQDPPNGGVTPVVFSAPNAPNTVVQVLTFVGQIPVVSGTTYHLSVQSVAQQGTRGVAQLLGMELDTTTALGPQ